MLTPLDALVESYGSQRAFAEAMGVVSSAVSNWRKSGIPDAAKWRMLRLARERGVDLDPALLDGAATSAGVIVQPSADTACDGTHTAGQVAA